MSATPFDARPGVVGAVRILKSAGMGVVKIAARLGIPYDVCRDIAAAPEWPWMVTRIEPDGSAWIVGAPGEVELVARGGVRG